MEWRDFAIIFILILLTCEIGLLYYMVKYNSNFLKQIQSIRGIQLDTLNVGDKAPFFRTYDHNNNKIIANQLFINQRNTLLLFINTNCPICKKVLSSLPEVTSQYELDFLIVNSDDVNNDNEVISIFERCKNISYIRSSKITVLYNIRNVPYAVLVNNKAVVQISSYIGDSNALFNILVNEKRAKNVI